MPAVETDARLAPEERSDEAVVFSQGLPEACRKAAVKKHTLEAPRASLLGACLLLPLAFGCGAAKAVRPDAQSAAEATGAKCDAKAENTNVYVVDLPPEKRSDLELALGSGDLVVVSFSCNELKILKTCKASGKYQYKGTSSKEHVLSLEDGDQIRAALPLGGAGIAASFEAEASTGTKFDLGLVISGQLIGSASSFTAAELTGTVRVQPT